MFLIKAFYRFCRRLGAKVSAECANMLKVLLKTLMQNIILETDVCTLPRVTGPCIGRFKKFYYDSQTQRCLPFIYGGCRGNENNFDNIHDCREACVSGKLFLDPI